MDFVTIYHHVTYLPELNSVTSSPTPIVFSSWTRLAMARARQLVTTTLVRDKEVLSTTAIFMQVYSSQAFDTVLKCLLNTLISVSPIGNVDIFICHDVPYIQLHEIMSNVSNLPYIRQMFIEGCIKGENHASMFLRQLQRADSQKHDYKLVLRVHSDTSEDDSIQSSESMCGTPEQVTSILKYFRKEEQQVGMVVPKGSSKNISLRKSKTFVEFCDRYLTSCPQTVESLQVVSGRMFWTSWKTLSEYRSLEKCNGSNYLESYSYFPTFFGISWTNFVLSMNQLVSEVIPAPRIFAFVFPQYHEIPENNRFWGKGFTEWTWLKPSNLSDIKKPLSWKEGGLGYYDLTSQAVRKRQGDMARSFGLAGFVFYHYWFNGKSAPMNHKVMFKPVELMLLDGHPDVPFMLSWANEPWDRHWTGGGSQDVNNEILMEQSYGNKSDWTEHFQYLSQFFKHENYIKLEGKPVFIIYRIGHIGEYLVDMLSLWRKMSLQMGFPGLYVIETIGSFYTMDTLNTQLEKYVDAALHFWPAVLSVKWTGKSASSENLPVKPLIQYWGSYSGFDKRVRDNTAISYQVNVSVFEEALRCSFDSMHRNNHFQAPINLYFITAWNEWNEQAVLEPDTKNKFAYLSSISRSLKSIPIYEIHNTNRNRTLVR
jgi:Glycosyltransferase WbsX